MATKSCVSTLSVNIMNDCNDAYGKGVEDTFYVIDRNAIDWGSKSMTDNSVKFNLLAGKRGYKIRYPSSETPAIKTDDNNPVIGKSWKKTLPLVFLANSPKNAKAIDQLKEGKYVAIWESTVKGEIGDQAFHVIGFENGAVGQDMNSDTSSDDALGGFTGSLVEDNAAHSSLFFFDTDYETTKASLESMCSEIE